MKHIYNRPYFLLLFILLFSCQNEEKPSIPEPKQFELMEQEATGIDFANMLSFDQGFNVYTYRNFYNGGGVSLGDINNDGLIDIYFTANLNDNKLYLNQGNFKFKDITNESGVAGKMQWSTGVTMADVNGDGWLDIYVCNSGDLEGDIKENELFINNQDMTFTEAAQQYGLNDGGFSTHASFFDYDKDGDLDAYLLNNSFQAIGSFNLQKSGAREQRDSKGGDKLLRNNNGFFEDVSEEAGVYGSVIGFGLGVTVGDVNNDGWEDIYVSNDFFERDYLYINKQDGTFEETLTSSMNSISGASMGADLADVNNDGYADLFVTEMLPSNDKRLKTVTTFENWDRYQFGVDNGYYHQFTRNMFQINNRNTTFSEVGRLAGVEASDWSWGALIFDMDNDGWKDIFIANGIYQDLTNQDYLNYISNEEIIKSIVSKQGVDYQKLVDVIPSNPVSNKAYRNKGGIVFEDLTNGFGLDSLSFSNGSAYGDLDNDGDLDLVVNNVNMPSFIYRNNNERINPESSYLRFELKGENGNTHAVGTQIIVKSSTGDHYLEQQPTKGFQSSIDPRPLVGLSSSESVKVTIKWPSGKVTELNEVTVGQTLSLSESEGKTVAAQEEKENKLLAFTKKTDTGIRHEENKFVDFYRDRLLYHMNSTEGPKMAIGDVNADGKEDFYLGGAKGYPGKLLIASSQGFQEQSQDIFVKNKGSEDTDALFFDADNDGDLDLYVCSGGSEFSSSSSDLKDRVYMNNGGEFELSNQFLPHKSKYVSTSSVQSLDFDKDGDLDLFVSERLKPFKYGSLGDGFLLENDGKGNFQDVTDQVAAGLRSIGMITSAVVADFNQDGYEDIAVAGEYMGVKVYMNNNGTFKAADGNLSNLKGWWSELIASDIDNDGDMDMVAGNHGTNSRFEASMERPLTLYVGDFDENGFVDPILTWTNEEGKHIPYALRHSLAAQMKFVLKKFPNYDAYKNATINDILDETMLNNASTLEVNTLKSHAFINNGNGEFEAKELPLMSQLTPIYAIEAGDFDDDGDIDLIMGGNLYASQPEVGRYDASYGTYLENLGNGEFASVAGGNGFVIDGEVRDIQVIGDSILVSRSNESVVIFTK